MECSHKKVVSEKQHVMLRGLEGFDTLTLQTDA
jgi:hypothetical protein